MNYRFAPNGNYRLVACLLCLCFFMLACNKQSAELALANNDSANIEESSITDVLEPEELAVTETLAISEFDGLIKEYASKYGFDWLLISAQVFTESSFNHEALSGLGAIGLMQIMPSTAKWLGTNPELLIEPEVNIELGCYYNFKIYASISNDMLEQEKLTLMLASYHSGPNRIKRLRKKYGNWDKMEPYLPAETRTYVKRIWNKYSEYAGLL